MSNSDVWPVIRSRCVACPEASASSSPSRSCAGCPNMLSAPDLGQRLEHLAVGEPQVDPRAEVRQRPELAAALARLDDRLDGALADVLDRQQAEADRVALDREPEARAVHVGRPDLDAQAPALDDRGGHLLGVVAERREHRGHVLDGVVGLEVRRLVRDQAVAGGVRLVEPVALERLERLEHGVDDLGLDAPLRRLGDELLLLRPQHRGLLLADRVAEGVRLGAREPAQGDRGRHDVLLVHEDPVGLLQVRLEQRVEVGHRLLAVLATDVGRDVVHRARPVERDHGGEVEHGRRLELADVAPHARGLELEDPGRLARREQVERGLVVERDGLEVDLDRAVVADEVDRLAQDREVGQAQEVELEQAEGLDAVHLELGHQRVGVGRPLERHELGQRLAADDDAGGVRGGVARHALELAGEPDQPLDLGVGVVHLLELGRQHERLVELDAQLVRDGLGDAVDLAVAHAHDPPDVADRGPRQHRAEGDDLGDVVLAVLAADVVDDLVPSLVLEVDVDVGHRHAVGVEEPLERQAVVDGVDGRDAQGVGHDRARGRAPAGRRDLLLPGEPDEVGHDQEVAGVAHRDDHAQLVVQPLLELGRDRAVAPHQARLALLAQPRLDGLAVGHREVRDPELAQRQREVAHVGDPARVADAPRAGPGTGPPSRPRS